MVTVNRYHARPIYLKIYTRNVESVNLSECFLMGFVSFYYNIIKLDPYFLFLFFFYICLRISFHKLLTFERRHFYYSGLNREYFVRAEFGH